jgi:hypothetical protein
MRRSSEIRDAAKALARRSVEARRRAWGEKEFRTRMREWGKMGGRPKDSTKDQEKKGGN